MQTRKLGWTDLQFTTIGYGSWALGGGDWVWSWGPQDDQASVGTIVRAMELGINWIDTAAVYGLGHSEEVVGMALKKLPRRPILATKCSLVWDSTKKVTAQLKKQSVRAQFDASLRRLGVDEIDLYQIHWPNPDEDIEEGWSTMADLVKEGKVRYIGVSNFSVEQLKRVQPIHRVASLQPPYSMLKRDFERELMGYCAANQIGVVVYSPMQKGLLTGKFQDRLGHLAADDHRLTDPDFQDPRLKTHLELVEQLRPIAAKHGLTVAQLAIAWVLRCPEVTSAIVGARKPSQIEETVAAGEWALPVEDSQLLDKLLAAHDLALPKE
ncbi:MAG: aldo/keto reductase [Anaerolineales bacterium]|nr:aldo/keto reductase [Anaerolineae bacterium]PWB56211.1 MAG: aldo/keto reductase [Anaerolineales bacterium]